MEEISRTLTKGCTTEKKSRKVPEFEADPHAIAIATTTFYPEWYSGEVQEHDLVDKVRGDLAIRTIKEGREKGYQIVVVDGGSSEAFKAELYETGVLPLSESERGMSASRRQAFAEAGELGGVKVICWVEPEKVSIIRDCLPDAVVPILNDEADVVVPKRTDKSFETYPDYQVEYERKFNRLWNNILRKRGLRSEKSEDLDVWFGPRFFRNDKGLINLFLDKYGFVKGGIKLHEIVEPELWPNATFLPIVAALYRGYRVRSIPVSYCHPVEQTEVEKGSPEFRRKRAMQGKNIIVTTIHFIRLLEGNSKRRSRLIKK